MSNVLLERETSAFPLSIGTSLAFESVFVGRQPSYDPDRKIPQRVDVKNYNECWVNVLTLIRNLTSSVKSEVFASASTQDIVDMILMEMDTIITLFDIDGQGHCKAMFYFSNYKDVRNRQTKGLEARKPTSVKQIFHNNQVESALKALTKSSDKIKEFSGEIVPSKKVKAFAMTHMPYDLVGFDKFEKLDLLESNTGILKDRSRWNSKYYPVSGEDMSHLPFLKKLLLIFGDKYLIKPALGPIRQQVMKTSVKRGWNPTTTIAKVNIDLGIDIDDPYMLHIVRAL